MNLPDETQVLKRGVDKGEICLGFFSFEVEKNLPGMEVRTIFDNIDVLCVTLETSKAPRKNSACGIRFMPQRRSLEPPTS